MTVFYVVSGATRFAVKRIVADSIERANQMAYEIKPEEWDKFVQSDTYEHYETLPKGMESLFLGEGELE